jgi:enoyl-CoA hydratase/carnithine racemase
MYVNDSDFLLKQRIKKMKYITYSVIDQIAEISLNHAPVNALNIPMLVEIVAAFKAARDS